MSSAKKQNKRKFRRGRHLKRTKKLDTYRRNRTGCKDGIPSTWQGGSYGLRRLQKSAHVERHPSFDDALPAIIETPGGEGSGDIDDTV